MKYKNKIILFCAAALLLSAVFWWGGNAPGLRGWPKSSPPPGIANEIEPANSREPSAPPAQPDSGEASGRADSLPGDSFAFGAKAAPFKTPQANLQKTKKPSPEPFLPEENAQQDKEGARFDDPAPEETTAPPTPQENGGAGTSYSCTISIRCDTLLQNLSFLDREKHELVPEDGVILPATAAAFSEGESVFDVLRREAKRAKIHMEYVSTPLYNASYIEGIQNLYEFDCGERSGWMYKVNGRFPGYGCSRYVLEDGDAIEWVYTCDLGEDIGGGDSARGQRE